MAMAPAPKKSEPMKAIPLRMKPSDYEALRDWCHANERDFGEWARSTLMAKMAREKKSVKAD